MIRLEDPGKLHFLHPPVDDRFDERPHEHKPHAPRLVLRHNVRADRPHPLDPLLVPEEADETEGEEAAIDRLDPRVVVEEAEDGTDRLATNLSYHRQLRHDEVLEALGHVLDLA